jgi:hypothetical protein
MARPENRTSGIGLCLYEQHLAGLHELVTHRVFWVSLMVVLSLLGQGAWRACCHELTLVG